LTGLETALTAISIVAGLYFLLMAVRTYLLCFSAFRYRRRLLKQGENEELLARKPFVSILIPTYNEENVVDRILRACTSLSYENYEVVVVDDSTDLTVEILRKWARHPRVKVIHRDHRRGWKGGALDEGLKHLDPRSEFVLVFDADFIPPEDIIQRLLGRFLHDRIAAVQGHHLPILNAAENWVTRAARTILTWGYSLDYPGRAALGGAPQLGGSVMMIRRDVLERVGGFGTSITEDYDLSLRLYLHGYEVFYDESVRVPCECPSSFKHFLRQICRWVEGRARDLRRRLWALLRSKDLSPARKLDILLDGLVNLAGPMAMIWMTFNVVLPFFAIKVPSLLDLLNVPWPVHLACNLFIMASLPVAAMLALKWEGEKRTAGWIACFILATWATVPFFLKAYLQGFLTESSYFHRTFKTGRILRLEELPLLPRGGARAPYAREGLLNLPMFGAWQKFFSYQSWLL